MEKTGWTETFNGLLMDERSAWLEMHRAPAATDLAEARKGIHRHLKDVGESGDIDLIVATEKALLVADLTLYANSGAMADSLRKALLELGVAERLLPKVRDSEAYRAVNEAHALPKNRSPKRLDDSVPNDEARQFFSSQAARLLNMDKSRLDAEEKAIVEQRKRNMGAADRLYAALQRLALDPAPAG